MADKDPFEGLTPEERKIVEEMIASMPEDVQEKIRNGEGKVIVSSELNNAGGNGISVGLGLILNAINEQMTSASMRGQNPQDYAMRMGAVELGSSIFQLCKAFPFQVDVIFKSMIVGIAANLDVSPKEMLEEMALTAPEEKTLHMIGQIGGEPGSLEGSPEAKDQIDELNNLFNIPSADEPDTNDDTKETK